MGVPKFFRYISERYPCLSELVRENQIPEFDNLYLDMNGIIHNCSHPDDTNVHFRITEEKIFQDIFHYIETLFRLIKPQKLFFMAVDGVAPRAKMNQQRGRRFRSAKESETMELEAKRKGEKLPDTERFDSNCITPGTSFMVRLQNALKHFVQVKISTNSMWRKCTIILSGHETPGEGEHKIMEYIRYLKAQPGFDPNTRHCLYGLDADLIMLGLCSHEIHFSLLREEVKFGNKSKKTTSVSQTRFFLLHLGLFREYLELEFSRVKGILPFKYDIENIVDDWIFMGFLVGNDFIPHLPHLHINSNALPILYNTYMEVLPQLDGYINEGGKLNLKRFEVFMKSLANVDRSLFEEQYADLKYLQYKQMDNNETFDVDIGTFDSDAAMDADLKELVKNTEDMFDDEDVDNFDDLDPDADTFEKEFVLHKRNYYINKLKYPEMTPQVLAEQALCYITALQWTLFYYYRGVKSWGWYYPHHYAPFISDIQNFAEYKIDFELGKPFLPFQQLLAVLPAASKSHLPEAYHKLMTDENSKVIDFYPTTFETDLNGKKQDWEAVVLIPFIDEKLLLSVMEQCSHNLTADEKQRNVHGPMFRYNYCADEQEPLIARFGMDKLSHNFCKITSVWRNEVDLPEERLVLGPSSGALHDVYFPGFPTLKHLGYKGQVKNIRARVFEQPTRNDSMVICVEAAKHNAHAIEQVAEDLMLKEVFVGWPHLMEAKVIGIINADTVIDRQGLTKTPPHSRVFDVQVRHLSEHHLTRMGIDLGEIKYIVQVLPLKKREYTFGPHGKMTLQKVWSEVSAYYPVQTVLKDITMYNPSFVQYKHVEDIFLKDVDVFMMTTVYYGSKGVVVDSSCVKTCGRIKVCLTVHPEPDFTLARQIQSQDIENYQNSYNAAAAIALPNNVFSMIAGNFVVVNGMKRFPIPDNTPKMNIGLQLKFPKKNEEVVGYTKKVNNQYLYSKAAVELVKQYWQTFPRIFQYLCSNSSNEQLFESNLFPNETGQLEKVAKWIKEQPYYKSAARQTCGTQSLEMVTLAEINNAVSLLKNQPVKSIKLQVKPHLLLKPGLNYPSTAPDSSADYSLFDRVVVVSDSYSVPMGYKGTIIAINPIVDPNPVRMERRTDVFYDVLFDKSFDEGYTVEGVAEKRVFKVSEYHLLNITFGINKFSNSNEQNPSSQSNPWTNNNRSSDANTTSSSSSIKSNKLEDPPRHKSSRNVPNNVQRSTTSEISTLRKENDIWQMLKTNGSSSNPVSTSAVKSDDKSDVLRKLLGINLSQNVDGQQQLRTTEATNVQRFETSRQINVEDMFKINTNNLPKPPQNWRQNSKRQPPTVDVSKNQNIEQNHNLEAAAAINLNNPKQSSDSSSPNFIYHPQPQTVRMQGRGMMMPHQADVSNRNFHQQIPPILTPPQGPNGPQNLLSNNSMYPPGHGAFIPLQAARKNAKLLAHSRIAAENVEKQNLTNKTNQNTSKYIPLIRDGAGDQPSPQQQLRQQKDESSSNIDLNMLTEAMKSLNSKQLPTRQLSQPKKSSRLAARFDIEK